MHQPFDPRLAGGIEQESKRFDIELAEFGQRTPVAHLGGTVEDPIGARYSGMKRLAIFEITDDRLDAPLIEP